MGILLYPDRDLPVCYDYSLTCFQPSKMKKVLLTSALLVSLSLSIFAQDKSNVKAFAFEKEIRQNGIQLLDVRRPEEFEEGHIKGSALANWEDKAAFEKEVQRLDKDKPVYVYCRSGKRSNDAAGYLSDHGFKKVVNLEGGILGWKQEGKAIEAGSAAQGIVSEAKH